MESIIATFAIIEDDAKTVSEIRRYLKEFDEEAVLHAFKDSKEFEGFYFKSLLRTNEGPAEKKWNPIGSLSEEELEPLKKIQFSKTSPFNDDELVIEIKTDTMEFEHISAEGGDILGFSTEQVWSKDFSLFEMIPEELEKTRTQFEKLKSFKQPLSVLLILQAPDRDGVDPGVWAFKADIDPREKLISLTLTPKNAETLKALGREDEIQDDNKGQILPIDVCYFNNNCIKDDNKLMWITKVATLLKKVNLWPEEDRPKFIAIRYDNDDTEKAGYSHPFIDDILCVPLDRLIFLQKTEIAMAPPGKVSPNYLFVQQTHDSVEAAKECVIEAYSDLGIAIQNPVPLKVGTPAKFYIKFRDQKEYTGVYGKVMHNEEHPKNSKMALVYFSFFALNTENFKNIRKQLTRDTTYKFLLNQNSKDFEYNPDNIFVSEEEKEAKTVALIDHDDNILAQAGENLKKELGNCHVIRESSYSNFHRKYLSQASEGNAAPPAKLNDLYEERVSFLVGINDHSFQMALNPPEEGQTIMGFDAQEIFSQGEKWMDLFDNHYSRELLTETLFILPSARRLKKAFELNTPEGERRMMNVEMVLEENDQIIRIGMSVPDKYVSEKKAVALETLDAIIIDHSLLPRDLDSFFNALNASTEAKGINTPAGGPKVIVTAKELTNDRMNQLMDKPFFGAVLKPLETRKLLFLTTLAIQTPYSMYSFENIGWKEEKLHGRLAKPGEIVELSEFGTTVKLSHKLRVGSIIYLFGSIYENAPQRNMCCRVYHTEEVDGEPGYYYNHVIYFGITDAFLKFTRAYIRETYVSLKKSGQS